jgi:hypothetical protein
VTAAFGTPLFFSSADASRQQIEQAALRMREAVVGLHHRIRFEQNPESGAAFGGDFV